MSQEIFEEFTSTFPICSVNLTSCICREITLESLKHEAPCFLTKDLKHRLSLRASRCLRAGKVLATRNETSRTLAPKKKARCQWPMSVILAGGKASETDRPPELTAVYQSVVPAYSKDKGSGDRRRHKKSISGFHIYSEKCTHIHTCKHTHTQM